MSGDKLKPLQWRILRALAKLEPAWTLTGGGALAGFYLKHRPTQDLDLFWHGHGQLGSLPREAEERLLSEGLEVVTLQSGATFHRARVSDGTDTSIVDFVAERTPPLESPIRFEIGDVSVSVDTPHEILVNKLCALLGRSELRDLVDVKALLESGASLERSLADAPRKDAGFSALTLAWVLKGFQPGLLARTLGWSEQETEEISRFHGWLIEKLVAAGAPE